ncbi:hypothetical protein [Aeromonas rivipollensis]|uniref:hypothetical protein n=1 Tax=Aeromonas rivipollensis TaxID=948519 RepID=UPI00373AEBCA
MAGLWPRAGTVSVTNGSNKVVGFGTQWKSAVYKPDKGHAFYGPDGKAYEIDYVESDTVLYLAVAYGGPTAADLGYSIDITRTGTIPALSRELSAFIAYHQGQMDGWQQVLTGTGTVTLIAPDGQQVQVPALSSFQPTSASLRALQALVPVKDKLPFFSGEASAELADFPKFARDLLASADIKAAMKTLSLPTAGGFGFRNKLINGAMQCAQRGVLGVIPAGSNAYTLDRWNVYSNNQAISWSQQGGPSGAAGASLLFNGAANTDIIVRQRIEARNCLELPGNKVTLSFYLYGQNAAGMKVTPSLHVPTNSDNYSAISLLKSAVPVTVPGPAFTKFSVTFDALPASVLNGLEVAFTTSGFNAGTVFAISNVQLEVGEVATSFEYRQYATEISLCQRYFQILELSTWTPCFGDSSTLGYLPLSFSQMRSAPSWSSASGGWTFRSPTGVAVPCNLSSNAGSPRSLLITVSFANTPSVFPGASCLMNGANLFISAEL